MMKRISHHGTVKGHSAAASLTANANQVFRWMMMTLFTVIVIFSVMILSGCSGGGGGDSSPAATTPTTDTNTYSGSAKVSGTVKLSSLTSSDTAQINSQTPSGRMRGKISKATPTTTEGIKLYVVGEDGELEDTGISCTLSSKSNGDKAYECDGVKDGVNYIVKYVKISGTGKALELKSHTYVPKGATAPESTPDVSPQTSVIVKALVDAIISATAGTGIDNTIVNTIIESVKTAIVTLVTSGAIQIPSMVVEVADTITVEDLLGGDQKNDKLDNTSGIILADETISNEIGYVAAGNNATQFDLSAVTSETDKAALIRKIFKDLLTDDKGGSEDMPEFFYKFFTWLYVSDQTSKAGDLLNTLIQGMEYPNINAVHTDQVTVANAIKMFNDRIAQLHTLLAKDQGSLTPEDKLILADTPGVIRGLFPPGYPAVTEATDLITPRAIAFVVFFDKVFMPETVIPAVDTLTGTADQSGQVNYKDSEYFRWDEKNLFLYLGFASYVTSHLSEFSGVDISGLHLHPGTVWLQSTNEQKDSLMLSCDIQNLESFKTQSYDSDLTGASGATVTLTYPKQSGGTGTIDLAYLSYGGGGGQWGLDPWNEAQMANPGGTGPVYINPDRVVSDFTSGTYTITVTYNGKTTSRSFTKTVITGMANKRPKLITPAGMPNWPGDNASQAELDAFNKAWEAYNQNGGRTNFTANVMDDGSAPGDGQTPTKAKITVTWDAPIVTLPDGVKMVYSVDIGQSNCKEGGNCDWTPVWNSWSTNKQIYGTSFTIPHLFDIQSTLEAQKNPYHINVNVNFIDIKTGDQLGSGGNAHSEFTVGEPIDPESTFTIRGLNAIFISDTNVKASDLRAALVKEVFVNDTFTKTIIGISDLIGETTYSLDFKIKDFLSGGTMNTSYNLILIEDPNNTLTVGSSLGYEITYWPDYSTGGLWFGTWGGVLNVNKNYTDEAGNSFNTQTLITGGEIIEGPQFYIGLDYYTAPDPTQVTPVSAADLLQMFTITGTVDISGLLHPVVVLVEEGYDSDIGYNVQTVIGIAQITGSTYTINTYVNKFYDNAGKPNGKWYHILLIEDTDPSSISLGAPIGLVPEYWPDWSNGNFGFDTWQGSQLHIVTDTYDSGTGVWTHNSVGVPGDTTTVTGPSLAMNYVKP